MPTKTRLLLLMPLAFSAFAHAEKAESVPNPSGPKSLQAHWGTSADGHALLSWLEEAGDGSLSLRYSMRSGAQWSDPRTIVAKRHFFRQPAESPSVISFSSGALLAEWVEVPEEASEAEYIYVSASSDGIRWTTPVIAHQNRSAVQHALVAMTASGPREASLVWLEALKGEDAPSTLRRTVVSSEGKVLREETVDSDVCTCCPTSIVNIPGGLLVAYRDHTPKDIRDIAVVRYQNGKWAPSKILNPDNWEINACPVNGAAAAAKNTRVAIGWYTEAQDMPRTQLIFSNDGGATFGKPIKISMGNSFGHTSVALDDQGNAFVSWLEEGDSDEGVRLVLRRVTAEGVVGPIVQVAKGTRSSIGYPRLLNAGGETWIAWGNSAKAAIQTARITK